MENIDNKEDQSTHKMRQTILMLFSKLLLLEIIMVSLHWGLSNILLPFGVSAGTLEVVLAHGVNIILVLIITASWLSTYFVISLEGVSIVNGIFYKKKTDYDLRAVQTIKVSQGIFGRILNYGTIKLENPLFNSDVSLRNISRPHICASLIKLKRDTVIDKSPIQSVVPQKN